MSDSRVTLEGFRLSPQQRHLWLRQHEDKSCAYRCACALQLHGSVDADRVRRAVDFVTQRCEILRTAFHCLPGMSIPLQVISSTAPPWSEVLDLSSLVEGEQDQVLDRLWHESLDRPFDYGTAALFRCQLVRLAADRWELLLSLPALCADNAGLALLVEEILAASTEDAVPTNDSLQYADLSEWQNELLESPETEAGRTYWTALNRTQLVDLVLPEEVESVEPQPFEPQSVMVSLPADLADAWAQDALLPPNIRLAGLWQALLWRLTGRPEIVVAVAFDGRKYDELQKSPGLFERYLPVIFKPAGDPPLDQVYRNVAQTLDDIAGRQEYFSWSIVGGAGTAEAEAPWIPYAFEYRERPTHGMAGGVTWRVTRWHACSERFKAKLVAERRGATLQLELQYDRQFWSDESAQRLAEEFATFAQMSLPSAACSRLGETSPTTRQRTIGEIPTVGPIQQRLLHHEFHAAHPPPTVSLSLHELFEAQVQKSPSHVAVVCGRRRWTYAQLEDRANRIARFLRQSGIRSETRVGICVHRSLEIVAGILGVLKAGGAYVPLDPNYPAERLRWILQDSQPPIVLAPAHVQRALPDHEARVVDLERDWAEIESHGSGPLSSWVLPESAAYLIYTSGSTGKPKGVVVQHANVVHSTLSRLTYYRNSVDAFLLVPSFAFDSSVAGIYWTLAQGGTLVIPEDGLEQDVDHLAELVERERISHWLSVPSLYAVLLEQPAARLQSLTTAIVAGEACPKSLVQRHQSILPRCDLFNEYGPTESTVWCTVADCRADSSLRTVPIGRPIDSARVDVLDGHLNLMPIGTAGELYVGGRGVTRGYHGRPDLTAERYRPDPFSAEPGGRMYKTGDLARYLRSGQIEFLGRQDHQVKIRGYRIELGEIESVLGEHPAVQEVVVAAQASPASVNTEPEQLLAALLSLDADITDELLGGVERLAE